MNTRELTPKRGRGRIPLDPGGEKMQTRNIRMTDEEWQQCLRLGGAPWVRERIRQAVARRRN